MTDPERTGGRRAMPRPVVLAVDGDPAGMAAIEGELRKRYGADYQVLCAGSGAAGLEALEQVAAGGGKVALVLADLRLPDMSGIELTSRAHTGWLPEVIRRDRWGFVVTDTDLLDGGRPPAGWPLDRPPMSFETSLPGVFAVGDVRQGSIKRVASAVGEGSAAIRTIHQHLSR